MKKKAYSLCPDCTACPEVATYDDGRVTIGEAPNLVTLNRAEWNELVRLVRSGSLDTLGD
jgi:hypothetical protein